MTLKGTKRTQGGMARGIRKRALNCTRKEGKTAQRENGGQESTSEKQLVPINQMEGDRRVKRGKLELAHEQKTAIRDLQYVV